ncbi:hypothetical protein IAU60_006895 [Kwoniella sp. DSM 27419]
MSASNHTDLTRDTSSSSRLDDVLPVAHPAHAGDAIDGFDFAPVPAADELYGGPGQPLREDQAKQYGLQLVLPSLSEWGLLPDGKNVSAWPLLGFRHTLLTCDKAAAAELDTIVVEFEERTEMDQELVPSKCWHCAVNKTDCTLPREELLPMMQLAHLRKTISPRTRQQKRPTTSAHDMSRSRKAARLDSPEPPMSTMQDQTSETHDPWLHNDQPSASFVKRPTSSSSRDPAALPPSDTIQAGSDRHPLGTLAGSADLLGTVRRIHLWMGTNLIESLAANERDGTESRTEMAKMRVRMRNAEEQVASLTDQLKQAEEELTQTSRQLDQANDAREANDKQRALERTAVEAARVKINRALGRVLGRHSQESDQHGFTVMQTLRDLTTKAGEVERHLDGTYEGFLHLLDDPDDMTH